MRVPILLVLPHHEPLRDLALVKKGLLKGDPNAVVDALLNQIRHEIDLPKDIEVTSNSSAVGLKIGKIDEPNRPLEFYADRFALRCFVEVGSLEDIKDRFGPDVFPDQRVALHVPTIKSLADAGLGTCEDVKDKLEVTKLRAAGLTGEGVAIAIMDSGFDFRYLKRKLGVGQVEFKFDGANSWSPIDTKPGNFEARHTDHVTSGPGSHGTMCAFAALLAAPKATLLDMAFGAGIFRTQRGEDDTDPTLFMAMEAFSRLRDFIKPDGPAKALGISTVVSSNSWSIANKTMDQGARYVDNPGHPLNSLINELTQGPFKIDIVFSAGNCGDFPDAWSCNGPQQIMGTNGLGDVLTIAGCDTKDNRVGYSSQGPSLIPGAPNKPDVAAYTHFNGSEAFGDGTHDRGTSAACPVAAGCVAALRTRKPDSGRPSAAGLIKAIQTTARAGDGQTSAPDHNYGYGVINPLAAARKLGLVAVAGSDRLTCRTGGGLGCSSNDIVAKSSHGVISYGRDGSHYR